MHPQYGSKEPDTTPPGSLTTQPLTPPLSNPKPSTSVQHIFQVIEDRKSGRGYSESYWQRYKLSPGEYTYVEQRLRTEPKLRFDYFPSASLFVLRMPSLLHEAFKSSIVNDIVRQLWLIAQDKGPASEFAQRIENNISATITFSDPIYGRHEPDEQFRYSNAQFPSVIIEVSYSQKRKDLARLAQSYILGSDGNISVMVAFDVDYQNKSGTLSMWRPRLHINSAGEEELMAYQTLTNREFRTGDGEVSSQTGLRLELDDFVPSALLPKDTKLGKGIFISFANLCAYLSRAEEVQSMVKRGEGFAEPLKPGVKKRPLSSTLIEELNTDDELHFQQEEARAEERESKDTDYSDS